MNIPAHRYRPNSSIARALQRRGISGTEVVIVMAVIAITGLTLMVVLNKSSETTRLSRCKFNLMGLHQATNRWTHSPGITDSTTIYDEYIREGWMKPHFAFCPGETSPYFNVWSPDNQSSSGGGGPIGFQADIDGRGSGVANTSYANTDTFFGDNRPSRQAPDREIIFADRGPKDGVPNATSLSYDLHGVPGEIWRGNYVFADGHIYTMEVKADSDSPFVPNGLIWGNTNQPDNVFVRDDSNQSDPQDTYLGIFVDDVSGQGTRVAIWD